MPNGVRQTGGLNIGGQECEGARPDGVRGEKPASASEKGDAAMGSTEKNGKRITRREFVKGAAAGAAAAGAGALAGCVMPPQVVTEKVEVPVEVTRVVEKVVEVEKLVEVPVQAGPVELTLYDPSGAVEVSNLFSPRLDTLEGKTVCEVASYYHRSEETFPVIRELLQRMYPTATIIPYTEFTSVYMGGVGRGQGQHR